MITAVTKIIGITAPSQKPLTNVVKFNYMTWVTGKGFILHKRLIDADTRIIDNRGLHSELFRWDHEDDKWVMM